MRSRCASLTLIVTLLAAPVAAHDPAARAHYLGNEGVLVAHGDRQVLFDAFFSETYGQYLRVPDTIAVPLQAAEAPFDSVDAVFVSHRHGDHFAALPTLAYLRAHPSVCLYAPQQVADALAAEATDDDKAVLDRVIGFTNQPGDRPAVRTQGDLTIEAVAVPHSGGARMQDISNIVFRVTLGDWPTVMHMGDAGDDGTAFSRQHSHWDARRTHMLFAPYWLLDSVEGRRILDERIRAGHVIGIHVPAAARGSGATWRDKIGADLFTDPGETREWVKHR